ncbi:hypothetical protein [Kribbella sp. NPDC051620]|uniref:hypothetical protein n=1 Tax=Kribbella sp. NPDC051620 TaxID=3364120 RepID=UPI0037AE5CE4
MECHSGPGSSPTPAAPRWPHARARPAGSRPARRLLPLAPGCCGSATCSWTTPAPSPLPAPPAARFHRRPRPHSPRRPRR